MTLAPFTRRLPAVLLAAACLAPSAHAAGLDIHADADLADIGLPLYPGAVKKPVKSDDGAGFSFGVWGGTFGFKVNALNYRSTGQVEDVAAFYREALGRIGPLLDCTDNKAPRGDRPPEPKKSGKSKALTCGDDHVAAGGRLYKAGTEADHRTVTITPVAGGVDFQLVRIEAHGTD